MAGNWQKGQKQVGGNFGPIDPRIVLERQRKTIKRLTQTIYLMKKFPPEPLPEQVRLIQKEPKYYWSIVGFTVFTGWYNKNNLTYLQGQALIIMSYQNMLFREDLKFWGIGARHLSIMKLVEKGLVQKIRVNSTKAAKKRIAYILTPVGREKVDTYEEFFNQRMDDFNSKMDNLKIIEKGDFLQPDKHITRVIRKSVREELYQKGLRERKGI